jgi:hypothetical protein
MSPSITFEDFTKDVASHVITIVKDEGAHRHIVCAKPGTRVYRFEIVTFPGYLVYVGDMGSYTFWRTEDMFTFFRGKDGEINPGYWGEKLEAVGRCSGREEFSLDKFRENVLSDARSSLGLNDDDELPTRVTEELQTVVCYDNEPECMIAARDFQSEFGVNLSGYWEYNNKVFTVRFLWCCYAIVWAINRYDIATATPKT